jgi:hypothetical protein
LTLLPRRLCSGYLPRAYPLRGGFMQELVQLTALQYQLYSSGRSMSSDLRLVRLSNG